MEKYKSAAMQNDEFILLHENETQCDLPHRLRGEAIVNVDQSLLVAYNEYEDAFMTNTTVQTISEANLNEFNVSEIEAIISVTISVILYIYYQ